MVVIFHSRGVRLGWFGCGGCTCDSFLPPIVFSSCMFLFCFADGKPLAAL